MKLPAIPKWKYWLSHIYDQHIVQIESEYSQWLNLVVSKGRLLLETEHAYYSYDDLYDNFFQAFRDTSIKDVQLQKVLVLGMGLGSIPFMLEHFFNQSEAEYTLVEIDPSVIQLASTYSLPRLQSSTQIIEADAAAFLHINSTKFDLIAVDIFIDDVTPSQFTKPEFFDQLYSSLSDSGRLYYNRYAVTPELEVISDSLYTRFIEKQYSQTKNIQVQTNRILYGKK